VASTAHWSWFALDLGQVPVEREPARAGCPKRHGGLSVGRIEAQPHTSRAGSRSWAADRRHCAARRRQGTHAHLTHIVRGPDLSAMSAADVCNAPPQEEPLAAIGSGQGEGLRDQKSDVDDGLDAPGDGDGQTRGQAAPRDRQSDVDRPAALTSVEAPLLSPARTPRGRAQTAPSDSGCSTHQTRRASTAASRPMRP